MRNGEDDNVHRGGTSLGGALQQKRPPRDADDREADALRLLLLRTRQTAGGRLEGSEFES